MSGELVSGNFAGMENHNCLPAGLESLVDQAFQPDPAAQTVIRQAQKRIKAEHDGER